MNASIFVFTYISIFFCVICVYVCACVRVCVCVYVGQTDTFTVMQTDVGDLNRLSVWTDGRNLTDQVLSSVFSL
jgi:hypothetical protein